MQIIQVTFTHEFDCELCPPEEIKSRFTSAVKEIPIKADVCVKIRETTSSTKMGRNYIYLCRDCYSQHGFTTMGHLMKIIEMQERSERIF